MLDDSKNKKSHKVKRVRTPKIHLILQNDNVNTLQHVQDLLINVCGMNPIAAEQAMIIAHAKGECPIITGPSTILYSIYAVLRKAGLNVKLSNKLR
jgi:ATP-dependent Clp protease adaptor protein ClpS